MALSQCAITGILYDNAGDPAAYGVLRVVRVTKDGETIIRTPQVITANASGAVSFNLPRASVAYLFANSDSYDRNGPAGVGVAVPDQASATLGELELSYGTVPILRYLPIKDEGTLLTSAPESLNFVGAGVTVTQASNVVTITISSGITDGDKGDITVSSSGAVWSIDAGVITNTHVNASAAIAYSKLALTGAILNADLAGSIAYSKLSLTGAILNADLAGAIAYSKLTLTGAVVNADISASAAIAYSKLNLATSIVNADISASAAIAYSKLNLATSIVNADVSASAAIAYSKLNLTGAILNADLAGSIANAKLANSAITIAGTSTSLGGSITTSAILDSLGSTQGQIAYRGASGWVVLATGTSGQFLQTQGAGANPQWASASASPAGSSGDFQYNNSGSFGAAVIAQSSGRLTATPTAASSGVASYWRLITPADTTLTASTESIGAQFGGNTSAATVTRQWATGALTTQRENLFVAPTYGFVGASTLTTAATVAISGAPIAGTNATITNAFALQIASGVLRTAGAGGFSTPDIQVGYVNVGIGARSTDLWFFAGGNKPLYMQATGSGTSITLADSINFETNWLSGATSSIVPHASGVLRIGNGSTSAGKLLIGPSSRTIGAQFDVLSSATGTIAGLLEGAASNSAAIIVAKQGSSGTGDAFQAQNSSGTVLYSVSSAGIPKHSVNSTGAGTALLGTNSPANTLSAPYTWLQFTSSDGSTVYVPAWK